MRAALAFSFCESCSTCRMSRSKRGKPCASCSTWLCPPQTRPTEYLLLVRCKASHGWLLIDITTMGVAAATDPGRQVLALLQELVPVRRRSHGDPSSASRMQPAPVAGPRGSQARHQRSMTQSSPRLHPPRGQRRPPQHRSMPDAAVRGAPAARAARLPPRGRGGGRRRARRGGGRA